MKHTTHSQTHEPRQPHALLSSRLSRTLSRYPYLQGSAVLITAAWMMATPGVQASTPPAAYYGMVNPLETPIETHLEAPMGGNAGSSSDANADSSLGRSPTSSNQPHPSPTSSPEFFASEFSPSASSVPEQIISQAPPENSPDAEDASPDESVVEPIEPDAEDDSFGDRGDDRWYVHGGAATTFANEFGMVGAGLSHFFINGHSINLELNGMAFSQTGDDAVGANLALLMRWHFIRQENWSLYVDGGAGLLGTTDDVPTGGSTFNFTPQAGGGATLRLNEDQHLMMGIRWHHISNAELFDGNPGRDSVMGYVGVNFPR
ncbi:MAG: acyloxyacyl hydrolase [Leptolyngbyaceae bacterium]|nr:acyloxyacyl hydrolase [Leptolyngbyaceae bacterium]